MVTITPTTTESKRGRMLEAVGFHEPTTMREVAARTGFTFASVQYHLHTLREQGMVIWTPRTERTIRLTPAGQAKVRERLSA